jgi:hypothetical protein
MFVATASHPTKAAVTSGPFSAFATGTAEHISLGDAPPTRLVDAEAAFSRAGMNSQGLLPVNNEVDEAIVPKDLESVAKKSTASFNSYGGGSGIEAGLGTTIPNNPDINQIILGGLAEQAADPPTPPSDVTNDPATNGFVTKDLVNINQTNPLLYANALRGQGKANWTNNTNLADPNPCGATQPLAFGLGHAADAQLINAGTPPLPLPGSEPIISTDHSPIPPGNNPGAADDSRSFTSLVPDPANAGHFIVHSENRQVLAPVTLFKGTANELTIQIGGEWVLKADASGTANGAHVTYASEGFTDPNTPVLEIIQGGKVTQVITTQQIGGTSGIQIQIPPAPAAPPILLNVTIGENAHKIGATTPKVESTDGTLASAAVDVAQVQVLNALPQFQLGDIRIGHMEVNAQAPSGGVTCSAPATTTSTAANGTTTSTASNGTTTTTAANGTTTTTAPNQGGGASTTTTAPGNSGGNGTTTTTAAGGNGNGNGNGTTTTTGLSASPGGGTSPPTTAQVQAVTFSQTPAAQAQTQTPNFTG